MEANYVWKIIPLLFSGLALWISIRVFFLFYRREIQKKQLDLVLKLIKNFQKCDINISCSKFSEKSIIYVHINKGNLFHVAKTRINRKYFLSKLEEESFNYPVFMTEETINRIEIMDFIRNPMLPNKIANCLRQAFPKNITYSEKNSNNCDLIQIDEYRILDSKKIKELKNDEYIIYVSNLGTNYGDFLTNINKTSSEINKFLKKVGVKNLNIEWNE
ncbi:hypothetical protein [uncultured Flavobacterium sp.]|uniref:hypothetical protein n=1 Tax=uncultured Flavobacterium sp. TaxID=165435 RepID=UPI0030C89A63